MGSTAVFTRPVPPQGAAAGSSSNNNIAHSGAGRGRGRGAVGASGRREARMRALGRDTVLQPRDTHVDSFPHVSPPGDGVFAFPSSLFVPLGNLPLARTIPFRSKTIGCFGSRGSVFDVGWHGVLSSMLGTHRLGVLPKHGSQRRRVSGCDGSSCGRLHSPLPVDPFRSELCLSVSIGSMGIAFDWSASTRDLDGTSTLDRPRVLERQCLPFSPRCLESTSTGDSFDSLL